MLACVLIALACFPRILACVHQVLNCITGHLPKISIFQRLLCSREEKKNFASNNSVCGLWTPTHICYMSEPLRDLFHEFQGPLIRFQELWTASSQQSEQQPLSWRSRLIGSQWWDYCKVVWRLLGLRRSLSYMCSLRKVPLLSPPYRSMFVTRQPPNVLWKLVTI